MIDAKEQLRVGVVEGKPSLQIDVGRGVWEHITVKDLKAQLEKQVSAPLPQPAPAEPVQPHVADHSEQNGTPEKSAASFLTKATLAETVMEDSQFYLKIQNSPYSPLVLERHGQDLHFIHYRKLNGDLFIETEAIFEINSQGQLLLKETASNAGYGEHRNCDRSFAGTFMRNLHHQGFVDAVKNQLKDVDAVRAKLAAATAEQQPSEKPKPEQGALFDVERHTQPKDGQSASGADDPSWNEPKAAPDPVSAIEMLERTLAKTAPEVGKAIADLGQQSKSPAQKPSKWALSKSLSELRLWYRAARDMNWGAENQFEVDLKLDSIALTGRTARQAVEQGLDPALTPEIQAEKNAAIEAYKPYQKRSRALLGIAAHILERVGQKQQESLVYSGKTYRISADKGGTVIERVTPDGSFAPIVVKKHNQLSIAAARDDDLQAFQMFMSRLVTERKLMVGQGR